MENVGSHFGSQRIPKGVHKSNFFKQIKQKGRKTRCRKASRKNVVFRWNFDAIMRELEKQKQTFRWVLVATYEVSVFYEKASKMEASNVQNRPQNQALGAQRLDFSDFGRFFERSDFGRTFDLHKFCRNSEKKRPWAWPGGTSLKMHLQRWGWRVEKGGRFRRFSIGDNIGDLI